MRSITTPHVGMSVTIALARDILFHHYITIKTWILQMKKVNFGPEYDSDVDVVDVCLSIFVFGQRIRIFNSNEIQGHKFVA